MNSITTRNYRQFSLKVSTTSPRQKRRRMYLGGSLMNSKWHLITSLIKSAIRIGACVLALKRKDVQVLAIGLLMAEALGVLEEVGDKR
jgi:ABC-type Fe3+-siderophore transport system permease subunit